MSGAPLALAALERRPRQARRTPHGRHFLQILLHLPTAIQVHVADVPHVLDVVRGHIRNRDVVAKGASLCAVLLAVSHVTTLKTPAKKNAFAFGALAESTNSPGRTLTSFSGPLLSLLPS